MPYLRLPAWGRRQEPGIVQGHPHARGEGVARYYHGMCLPIFLCHISTGKPRWKYVFGRLNIDTSYRTLAVHLYPINRTKWHAMSITSTPSEKKLKEIPACKRFVNDCMDGQSCKTMCALICVCMFALLNAAMGKHQHLSSSHLHDSAVNVWKNVFAAKDTPRKSRLRRVHRATKWNSWCSTTSVQCGSRAR